ncbi:MAG: Secretion system C-terminal sorting domain, partial [Bacteroidota bacterium]
PILNADARILTTTANDSTDLLGDYRTGYPTAGTFSVEFSATGYNPKTINGVVLTNGNVTVLDVTLDPFVGLSEMDVNPVKVSPNPSNSKVNIQIDGFPGGASATMMVVDMKGSVMHHGKMLPGGRAVLDMSTWCNGVYSLQIKSDQFTLPAQRLIKN